MENSTKQSDAKDVPSLPKNEETTHPKMVKIKNQLKEICDLDNKILNQLDCLKQKQS